MSWAINVSGGLGYAFAIRSLAYAQDLNANQVAFGVVVSVDAWLDLARGGDFALRDLDRSQ
jgi:hypothetical protein